MKDTAKSFVSWLATAKLLSVPRRYIERALVYYYWSKNEVVFNFTEFMPNQDIAQTGVDLIKRIKQEIEMLLKDQEAFLIYSTAIKTEKIEGEIAEVGVYQGGSAKILREASKKPLHLFDTFEGLPELNEKDDSDQFQKGNYSASLESVKNYLSGYPNIYYYKGLFPSTAEPVKDKKFSFVHFDVDIYESTLGCLNFFYSRLSKGGVIISHDYASSGGVRKAFDEFFEDKPEIIIQQYGTVQAFVVKL